MKEQELELDNKMPQVGWFTQDVGPLSYSSKFVIRCMVGMMMLMI